MRFEPVGYELGAGYAIRLSGSILLLLSVTTVKINLLPLKR